MGRFVLRRLAISVITVLGLALVAFFVSNVLPGDPAAARLGPEARPEDIEKLRQEYGLDRSIGTQLVAFLGGLFRGDLGISISTGRPVTQELLARLPATIELASAGLLVALIIGFPIGMMAANFKGRVPDVFARVVAVLGSSMASFWLGLLLIYGLFSVAGWFPGPTGRLPVGMSPPTDITGLYFVDSLLTGNWDAAWQTLRYLALPALTLGIGASAAIIKMVRSAMLSTRDSGFVRTATAYGVPKRTVIWVDQLRNAMLEVLTIIGLVFGFLLGGNIIVEQLFSWPGLGRLAYDAMRANDLQMLQADVLIIGALYILLNLAIDVLYGLIDPRIRLGGGAK